MSINWYWPLKRKRSVEMKNKMWKRCKSFCDLNSWKLDVHSQFFLFISYFIICQLIRNVSVDKWNVFVYYQIILKCKQLTSTCSFSFSFDLIKHLTRTFAFCFVFSFCSRTFVSKFYFQHLFFVTSNVTFQNNVFFPNIIQCANLSVLILIKLSHFSHLIETGIAYRIIINENTDST